MSRRLTSAASRWRGVVVSALRCGTYDAETEFVRTWLERKFWVVYAFGFVLLALMVTLLAVVVLLVVRLQHVESASRVALAKSQDEMQKMAASVRNPLERLLGMAPGAASFRPPDGVPVSATITGPRRFPENKYSWAGCQNLGKCTRPDYFGTTPPLLIISLDGFARRYLDHGIVKTLDKIAECGAKAEYVIPSFPTKTFPNHNTIVTGLYPESHGVADNNVYDPAVSPDLEDMKKTKKDEIFQGEQIWSVYKRETGRKTASMMYPMSNYNASGFGPDYTLQYTTDLPFRNRIKMIIEWLEKPLAERPGLIAAYYHEPDNAGHYHLDSSDIDTMLYSLDKWLDDMMRDLSKANLLECINLVVLADHGMQRIHDTYYFDEVVDDFDKMITVKGVVGRIHLDKSNRTADDVAETFTCNKMKANVWTRDDLPTRKHYAKTPRVGDVIVEGHPGTMFYSTRKDDYFLTGDHGYDYIQPHLHTIFFARGPSIKQNVTIPAFQNVEYMNLWMDLLELKTRVPNNGTKGTFDEILVRPQIRPAFPVPFLSECPGLLPSAAKPCGNSNYQPKRLSVAVNNGSEFSSFLTNFDAPEAFQSKMLEVLNSETEMYLEKFGRLLAISGTAHDANFDGKADENQSGAPTHFYRILAKCDSGWADSAAPRCKKPEDLEAIAFILPINDKPNRNCLDQRSLLTEYMARVKDVELISGLEFQFDGLDPSPDRSIATPISNAKQSVREKPASTWIPNPNAFRENFSAISKNEANSKKEVQVEVEKKPPPPEKKWRSEYTAWIIQAVGFLILLVILMAIYFRLTYAEDHFVGAITQSRQETITIVKNIQEKVLNESTKESKWKEKYPWAGCEKLGKCERTDYAGLTPPLVILSLDGFAKRYLDRGIVTSLDAMAECGVRAEYVNPSFPSSTFPNHHTILTGLYPESHGVVDNNVYDPLISATVQDMKKTQETKLFLADTIWEVYKKETGNKTACLMFPLCVYNHTGYGNDYKFVYSMKMSFDDRIKQIVDWLKLPPSERPGLITAYYHEPDGAGHRDVLHINPELETTEKNLDKLFRALAEENLLECINLVILSDHGMQALHDSYYFNEKVKDAQNMVFTRGVVGHVHLNNSKRTADDVVNDLGCGKIKMNAWTPADIPTRLHHSASTRIGDVIVEGHPGSVIYNERKQKNLSKGEHGYDNVIRLMQAIFFARGPAFKPGVEMPAFQNIEYMNLWMDLLKLKNRVPTNGTEGTFDEILVKPPLRSDYPKPLILECPSNKKTAARSCWTKKCVDDAANLTAKLQECENNPRLRAPIVFKDSICFMDYCDSVLVANQNGVQTTLVEWIETAETGPNRCEIINEKYSNTFSCPKAKPTGRFLTANNNFGEFTSLALAHFVSTQSFNTDMLDVLQKLSESFIIDFERLLVISGTAHDSNHDGLADDKPTGAPTHFYRILARCDSDWADSAAPRCRKPEDLKTIAFILPINDKPNRNCLDQKSLLNAYMARVKDVELISGLEFQFDGLDRRANMLLRTKIHKRL
ncbi:unnamed protein product [Caenorhabditis auriculariae]|uniref:ENPP1-3/EXOG-like endonuclease/phosphodiesterase domain-containing protein n=1 Tax=Caenorhabditis auriculariae TaxID=2777116 RepID=A0A8S1HLC8_9PELO|nr:unnamed protein product [Caenorhabditis auriculariae]